jgi:RNA polymerase sigma-70 factor (ECF subfamily)
MSGCHDDHSLVRACLAGQTEAFGILVERYQERLFPTIARLLGSPEDAQDVLQDTFLRAFEKLDQFQGESSFYTWLYRIAVNLALSGYRKRHGRHWFGLLVRGGRQPILDPPDRSRDASPECALEHAERELLIEKALDSLGPEHRAVVILKDFDGHRYEEISKLLEIPIGTVRSRLHRARCELRELLRPLIDEEPLPIPTEPAAEGTAAGRSSKF